MAVLTDLERSKITTGLMRYWSTLFEPILGIEKADLRAAVNATDDWIEANQAAYNSALPVTFRNNATLPQKTLLFCVIATARVSLDFLRSLLGDVD